MKLKTFLIALIVIFGSSFAFAGNTVVYSHPVINISAIDSDWDDSEGRRVQFIIFVPGAVDDELVMRQGTTTGPAICGTMKSTDGEARICPINGTKVDMFLDFADSTLTAGSEVTVLLWEK